MSAPGVDIEVVDWSLEGEVLGFQSLDIGLYPITTNARLDPAWLAGKSGFKAIQYLAVGVPFVMSPVGVCAEIGEDGKTHVLASTADEWYEALERLLTSSRLRQNMGEVGREHSLQNYSLRQQADRLAESLKAVLSSHREQNL